MATANAINDNTQGLSNYNGSGTFTAATTNQYNVLVGSTNNGITNIAPSATSGVAVISQGVAADPVFGTVVVAGGGTGAVSLTDHGVLVGSGTSAIDALAVGTTGQLLVGASTADPAFASSATGDFTFTSATAGATRTFTVSNTDNTNGASTALSQITTGGATAGDPKQTFTVTGATSWSHGIDNSASDAFVISQGTALGTNNVMSVSTTGEINYPLQPAFFGYLGAQVNDVTGTGTQFTLGTTTALTEVYDQNGDFNTNGTFTAPVTGRYALTAQASVIGCTVATTFTMRISTSNRLYTNTIARAAGTGQWTPMVTCFADMDAGDTATAIVFVSGEAGDTDDIFGHATDAYTYFSGYLIA